MWNSPVCVPASIISLIVCDRNFLKSRTTLLDLRGPIPSFIEITDGRCHDVNALDALMAEPGAFYVMDRGYLDSDGFNEEDLHSNLAWLTAQTLVSSASLGAYRWRRIY